MSISSDVLDRVRHALSAEPRIDLARHPIATSLEGRTLVLAGVVPHVAAKRLALRRAAAVGGVDGIVDRLRVEPARAMTDAEVRDGVCHALLDEGSLRECELHQRTKGRVERLRGVPPAPHGAIEVAVEDGVVTLDGEVPSLEHKRLAGVLCWWVPGSRDVINGLAVDPPVEDDDDQLRDAVRLVLEKDPFLDASGITISATGGVVALDGAVPKQSERHLAEADAWYVFGVDDVVDHLVVRARGR